jgi:hypothetical protein
MVCSSSGRPGLSNGTFSASRLWATDGTAVGTRLLLDLRDPTIAIPDNPCFSAIRQVGNRAFFPAATSPLRNELWFTDGSADPSPSRVTYCLSVY